MPEIKYFKTNKQTKRGESMSKGHRGQLEKALNATIWARKLKKQYWIIT